MSDFIIVTLITGATAVISFLIFALCVKQASTPANLSIEDAFNEMNTFRRKIAVFWRKNRFLAVFMTIGTLWILYMRLKRRNVFGFLDISIVNILVGLLIVMASIDITDIVYEIVIWLKTKDIFKS
jgi:hypothetical protein